ncbi:MAG: DapH/DapD/GlmU-related protein [Nevskia sp.]
MNRLIDWILQRGRGRGLETTGGVSAVRVLQQMASRGAMPALRGLLHRWRFGRAAGAVFLGRGVRLLAAHQLMLGRNVYIGDYSYLNAYSLGGVTLGDHVTLREWTWLQLTSRLDHPGDSIRIGDRTYIGPRSVLGAAGPLVIGARCQIGANVSFVAEQHVFEGVDSIFDGGVTRSGITIGDDCWIGNNAVILDGVEIGEGSVIGAASVVTRSVPAGSVCVGSPARIVRSRQLAP